MDRSVFKRSSTVVMVALSTIISATMQRAFADPASTANETFEVVSSEPDKALTEKFQEKAKSNWAGADAAYSMPIGQNQTLWMFGDTFLRRPGTKPGDKNHLTMINNSAAVQQIDSPQAPLTFFWKRFRTSNSSLIKTKNYHSHQTWLWPLDGTNLNGTLYEFMNEIKSVPDQPQAFGFAAIDQLLMTVANPTDKPTKWVTKLSSIKASGLEVGNAVTSDENYMYVYCSYFRARTDGNQHPQIVARVPLALLQDADKQELSVDDWEFWSRDSTDKKNNYSREAPGVWAKKNTAEPVVIFSDGAPEFTVNHVKGLDGFFSIYFPCNFGKDIMLQHAPSPEGPWSKPQCIYHCPIDTAQYFVYSAKNHPELCTEDGELCITYCINRTATAKKPVAPEKFYYPHAIRIQLKSYKNHS